MEKVIGTIIVLLIGFTIFAFVHDSNEYSRMNRYIERCEQAGGFSTDIQSGFTQHTLQCSVKINEEGI